jgi:hypothetical protein
MPGVRRLETLLANMRPEMAPGIFVFCSLPEGQPLAANITPVMLFREREGITYVVRREEAEQAGLSCEFPSRLISLTVHSSLDAVGFLAAIVSRLADAGISVNPVAGFHHDHLFVPQERADEALRLLSMDQNPLAQT